MGRFLGIWRIRKHQVNAFRQYGNKGLVNYWWANDLARYGLTIQNGRWHHVAATFDKWRRRLFLDFRPVAYRGNRNNYKLNVRTKKNFCVGKTYGKSPYSIEARIRPSRKSHWGGGIVGYGSYRRKNSVNAFRIAGRDGLYNYYWGNDLFASASWIKKRGRRVHDGGYHRVAATFDGWYQRIYVDFRVVRWRRTTGPVSLRYKKNFCIGKTYGREYFKGRMGDVRVYRWARAVADMRKRGC